FYKQFIIQCGVCVIFRDRLQLNQTGSLTIENMRTEHSGLYKLQIDHNTGTTHRKFTVTVYESPSVIDAGVAEMKLMSLKEGDPVILQTDVPQLTGDELIVWRFGDEGKLIAKHDIEAKSSPLYDTDERFRDRLQLNDQTGSLSITNTRTTDSGLYTAKISSNKQTLYKRFIVTVSAATVSVMEGDSVTLHTDLTEILNDDTLLWLFGPKEFVISQLTRKSDLTSFFVTDDVGFRGRLHVDQNTGSLTIRNTRKRHSGQYKLTISREKITSRIFSVDVFGVVGETGGVKSVSVLEGDSVTLQNDVTELEESDLIVWRFGDKGVLLANIDVETNEASINVDDERFRNRLQLNQTGSLTIKNARTEHTGLYEVQIRGRESSQQFLLSVSARPIPDPGPSTDVTVGIVVAVLLVAALLAAVVIYYRHRISKLQKQVAEEKTVPGTEGRSVNLETGTELRKGDEIKWWFEDLILIEFTKKTKEASDTECDVPDGIFRNKLVLNEKTGDLIINNIRTIHSGLYKLQISRKNGKTEYMRFIVTVTVKEVPAKVGESVTLDPGLETLRSDLILWTFGAKNCLVIKAESGTTSISDRFRDRLELNHQTGSLTITNTTDTDFGLFQLQIINRDRTRYRRFNLTDTMNESTEEKPLLN
ncbi:uncharacterized protein, partial [Sinocyclocheilus grahami]|uniref:uncharacterized protein n=1 Tax=Sinocyclocheilus grahami TaxID=75366 RepID=UPI0007AC7349